MHLMVLGASRRMMTGVQNASTLHVSMHLMVLGASRHVGGHDRVLRVLRLNAPDGAGCFPTLHSLTPEDCRAVSMHLMVLGASRLKDIGASLSEEVGSQCT